MAGIGIKIKELADRKKSLNNYICAHGYGQFCVNGVFILFVITIIILKIFLKDEVYSGIPFENLLTTISFSFVFGSLLISGYSFVLTRYISDLILKKEYQHIVPSFWGAAIISIILCGCLNIIFYNIVEIQSVYILSIFILQSITSLILLEMIYLSSISEYKIITKYFGVGILCIIVLITLNKLVDNQYKVLYILSCFNFGFSITAGLLIFEIKRNFGLGSNKYFTWIKYFKEYPSLIFIGLFFTFGIYIYYFLCKFYIGVEFVYGFLSPTYVIDLPFFIAALSILPGIVNFVVWFESSLFYNCENYLKTIIKGGILDDITYKYKRLNSIIKTNFIKLVLFQGISTISCILIGIKCLKIINLGIESLYYVIFFTVGLYFIFIIYVFKIVVLYLDGRIYALKSVSIFFILNVILGIMIHYFHSNYLGMEFSLIAFIVALLSIISLKKFLKNLNRFIMRIR